MLNLTSVSSDKIDKNSEILRNESFGIYSPVSICCMGKGVRMNPLISSYTNQTENRGQTFADSRTAGTAAGLGAFQQAVLNQRTEYAAMQGDIPARQMSMEEYKQYIAQQIRQMPVHPSRWQENIFVCISEEGYAAMKNDPDYEAWVLEDLRSALARPGFCFGSTDRICTSIYYGATKEECRSGTWSVPSRSASDRARERREENRRRLEKRLKRKRLQKRLAEEAFRRQERQRALVKKLMEHRQEIEKANRQRWKKAAMKDKPDGTRVMEITFKHKNVVKIIERDVLRLDEVLREKQREAQLQEMRMQQEMQRIEAESEILLLTAERFGIY